VTELLELVVELVDFVDESVVVVLVVVERVEGTEVVVMLGTVDDELSVREVVVVTSVVVTSVEVGAELELGLELELELGLELEPELELVVMGTVVEVGSDEALPVVSAVVVGSLLELAGAADEVEAVSELVALSWRFTTRSMLAIFSSSSCRASAALMSVGKMPWRNLVEKACKASWMEASLIPSSASSRDSRGTMLSSMGG